MKINTERAMGDRDEYFNVLKDSDTSNKLIGFKGNQPKAAEKALKLKRFNLNYELSEAK
jgi:hypothetical protein